MRYSKTCQRWKAARGATDAEVVKKLKEYFCVVYKDDQGQAFFFKEDFYGGLVEFFKDQGPVKRANDVDDYAIAFALDAEYENYVKNTNALNGQV